MTPSPLSRAELPRFLTGIDGEWLCAIADTREEAEAIFRAEGYGMHAPFLTECRLRETGVPTWAGMEYHEWFEPHPDGQIVAWEYQV